MFFVVAILLNYMRSSGSNRKFYAKKNQNTSMRIISYFSSLAVSLVVAGTVAAAAQQNRLEADQVVQSDTGRSHCVIDRLVQNSSDSVEGNSAGLNPERISMLNWNVYKGKRANWTTDFKRYTHKHDLVIIQEAHLGDELKAMLDAGHQYWILNEAFHYADRATGVMTASRVKPAYSCGQRTVEPWIRFPKTSLVSYYPIEGMGQQLLVANIHGVNFTLGVGAYKVQIEKLYDVIKRHDGPVILAGDFNTWSDGRMRIVNDLADRLALESLDYTNHNRTSVFGNALDHVFYRGLDPVEHDTWHVTSSDHNPTRVSFSVSYDAQNDEDLAAIESDDEDDSC